MKRYAFALTGMMLAGCVEATARPTGDDLPPKPVEIAPYRYVDKQFGVVCYGYPGAGAIGSAPAWSCIRYINN